MRRAIHDWARHAIDLIERGDRCSLVSVLAIEGSTPREAGTRMVVTEDQIVGTIGGGKLEWQAVSQARLALREPPGTWRIQDYPLGALLGQCCGGRVRLLIEHLHPTHIDWLRRIESLRTFTLESRLLEDRIERQIVVTSEAARIQAKGSIPKINEYFIEQYEYTEPSITLFGAGHIGQAIARILSGMAIDWECLDCRDEVANIQEVVVMPRSQLIEKTQSLEGYTLILTHDHLLDYDLVAASLRSRSKFIGLIGSKTKRERFLTRLNREGFDEQSRGRIVCPIGLPEIRGKDPAVIAVSVVAQLLQLSSQTKLAELHSNNKS